jgi:hypothetical protein
MLLAVLSLAFYNETKPFLRESTNLLAVVAQYAVLMTFGTALVIEVDVARGMNPLVLGLLLSAANLAIVTLLVFVNAVRYMQQRRERHDKKARQAEAVEWAVGFSKNKFATTLSKVEKEHLPPTHALVYWYGSMSDAKAAIRSGLPALHASTVSGVVVTLHRPHEMDESDAATFTNQEAMLACAVPWDLLKQHETTITVDDGGARSSSALCVIPVEVLTAVRGSYFGALIDPQPCFQGGVLLPPHQIVRAYMLLETAMVANTPRPPVRDQQCTNGLVAAVEVDQELARNRSSTFGNRVGRAASDWLNPASRSRGSTFSSFLGRQSILLALSSTTRPSVVHDQPRAVSPSTCLQFTNHMNRYREVCKANGWELVYHYTQPKLLPLILKTGFRMSTQGQGDGGVYFSTLGPAAYALGTDSYEENIIVDCFGVERLEEYKGKGMLAMCLVYGAEAAVLTQAPGTE